MIIEILGTRINTNDIGILSDLQIIYNDSPTKIVQINRIATRIESGFYFDLKLKGNLDKIRYGLHNNAFSSDLYYIQGQTHSKTDQEFFNVQEHIKFVLNRLRDDISTYWMDTQYKQYKGMLIPKLVYDVKMPIPKKYDKNEEPKRISELK